MAEPKAVRASDKPTLPAHVAAFLERQVPSIKRGIEHIATLADEHEFEQLDIQLEGTEQAIRIVRGYLLRTYKDRTSEARTFSDFLKKRGISRSTAYDYLAEAAVFDRLKDEAACEVVANLGAMKVRALKHLNDDELDALCNGGDVRGLSRDEIESLTATDVAESLTRTEEQKVLLDENRKLKAQLAQKDTEKGTAEAKQKKLEALLDMRRDETSYPDLYLIAREESRALNQKAELCLDDLGGLFWDSQESTLIDGISDETINFHRQAMVTTYLHTAALAARFVNLVRNMEHHLDTAEREMAPQLRYSPSEAKLAAERHEAMMAEHQHEAQTRADAREASKPRGRGRPKKAAE